MNGPVAKLSLNGSRVEGTLLQNKGAGDYANLWGIKNFATSRLLTKDQVKEFSAQNSADLPEATSISSCATLQALRTQQMMRNDISA